MIKDTLYAQYIKDRENAQVIENSDGFIIFRIARDELFLRDIYVVPSKRRTGAGASLLQELESIARENGCNVITANIFLVDPNANNTLAAALACGFHVVSCGEGILVIAKEVEDQNG